MNALFFLLPDIPDWNVVSVWLQQNAADLVVIPGAFAGMLATIPFLDKKREQVNNMLEYGFTSWSTASVVAFLIVDVSGMGIPKALATAFVCGLGGFRLARRLYNQAKDPVKGIKYWRKLDDDENKS